MHFNSIKTASLGAFALTVLGTTAISGTANARPYDNSFDSRDYSWRNYSTNVEFNGWSGETAPRAGKRHSRKHAAKARRAHKAEQAQYGARIDQRNPDGTYMNSYALQADVPTHARRAKRERPNHQAHPVSGGFGGGALVSEARRYIGGNPTGRSSLWCGAFMDMILQRTGHRPGSNLARDYANYGTRISGPQIGAIAVMSRGKRGGHVGVVSGIDEAGNPIVISGNHGNRVAEATYSRGRIYAYVMP
jgi:uncharacterized protein (TIGR02594 family)